MDLSFDLAWPDVLCMQIVTDFFFINLFQVIYSFLCLMSFKMSFFGYLSYLNSLCVVCSHRFVDAKPTHMIKIERFLVFLI